MKRLPDFVYSMAFWEALSLAVSGVLAVLAFFGVVEASWAVPSSVLLQAVVTVLRFFGISPELRAKLLDKYVLSLEKENKSLMGQLKNVKAVKKVNK